METPKLPARPTQQMETTLTSSSLPTIQEIFEGVESIGKTEGLLAILNHEPKPEWVKEHPYIKGWKYLPIGTVEYLLKKVFKRYSIEVLKTGLLMNAVEVTVRIHYLDPATGEMMYHDGVGAQELQTMRDTGALKLDMSNVNRGAVQMALPIAKTLAIKDACDHFGRLFGADLNRKDLLKYEPDMKIIKMSNKEKLAAANGN